MIQDTLSKVVYTADGIQRKWGVSFPFNDSKDLHIYLTDDGVRVEEVFQNFEVVENGEKKEVDNPDIDFNKEGNYVIYPTEESGLAPLEAGKQILILRETPNTQEEDSSEIYFKSKDIERGLDKLTMQVQELARDSYRAVKVSHFDTTTPEDFTEMLFESAQDAKDAAARAAVSEANAALSEQNAASSAFSAQSASATATAAAQLAESLKSDTEEFAKRAENAASDASASATQASESAHMASDLLQEVSNSIYNKEQIDEKVAKLEGDIALVEEDVTLIEGFIPNTASTSNQLVTKQELESQITAQSAVIAGKQDKLIAGPNITINGNVISAIGGGSGEGTSEAVWGNITGDINAQTDLTAAIAEKQDKLTAGEGITIEGNVISATGGGSAELPDNVYTQDNLIAGENVTFSEVLPEGGIDEHTLACWNFDNYTTDSVNQFSLYGVGSLDKSYSKFGGGSCHFTITYTASDISQIGINPTKTSITADFWVKAVGSNSSPKVGFGSYNSSVLVLYISQDSVSLGGTAWSDTSIDLGVVPGADFNHYALQYDKDKKTATLFFNGKKIIEQNVATELTATSFNDFVTYSYYQARIDELRISNVLRYDGDFTPPTEPYTLAVGPSKKAINAVIPEVELPNTVYTQDNLVAGENIEIKEVVNPNIIDDNTLLCWHFDGDTKDVVNGEDFTLYPGYGTLNTTYYKFGTASAPDYVQNGLYITLKEPLTDKDNFTLDYWIYGHGVDTDTLSFTTRLAGGIGATNGTSIYLRAFGNDQNLLDVSDANGNYVGSLAKSNSISSKEWSHWAYTYNKDTREFSVYANGVKQGAYAFPSGNPFNIEIIYPVDTNYNQFAIDEFRLTKALAWDKNFTPPTEAYAKGEGGAKKAISAIIPEGIYTQSNLLGGKNIEIIPEPVEGGIDEHTIGMWHFDSSMTDEINGKGFSYDRVGSYIDGKFGKGVYSVYGGRTDSEILCETQSVGSDFTIDCVVLPRGTSSSGTLFYLYAGDQSGDYYGFSVAYSMIGGSITLGHRNATLASKTLTPLTSNDKPHLALQRRGNLAEVFIEGKKEIEYDISSIVGELTGKGFGVNSASSVGIDELRISNTARYTEDFTPPTKPYSVSVPTGNMVINGATKTSQLKNDSAFVSGDGVLVVKKLTQEEYDALETKNEYTLYVLV